MRWLVLFVWLLDPYTSTVLDPKYSYIRQLYVLLNWLYWIFDSILIFDIICNLIHLKHYAPWEHEGIYSSQIFSKKLQCHVLRKSILFGLNNENPQQGEYLIFDFIRYIRY
jgi:hypothetical protein